MSPDPVSKPGFSLSDLCAVSSEIAAKSGFSNQSFPEFVALVHSELSEALEEYRQGRKLHETYYTAKAGEGGITYVSVVSPDSPGAKPEGIPSELADVIIRVCHFCGENGIDIDEAVRAKTAYNRTRSYKHDGKIL